MTTSTRKNRSVRASIALSQLFALMFLAACLWWVMRELELLLPNDRITASLSVQQNLGSALARPLAAFGASLLLIHYLLGVL